MLALFNKNEAKTAIFGDGSDLDKVISANSPFIMDRVYYFNRLILQSGAQLYSQGYPIFVKDILSFAVNTSIIDRGQDSDGPLGGLGAGQPNIDCLAERLFSNDSISCPGRIGSLVDLLGGSDGSSHNYNSEGNTGSHLSHHLDPTSVNSIGLGTIENQFGKGGNGGTSYSPPPESKPFPGSFGGRVSPSGSSFHSELDFTGVKVSGASGGGASVHAGGGGGGNIVRIFAKEVYSVGEDFVTVDVRGGNGADGAGPHGELNSAMPGFSVGGGGSGGGGSVILITENINVLNPVKAIVQAGRPGKGYLNGEDGQTGTSGTFYLRVIKE